MRAVEAAAQLVDERRREQLAVLDGEQMLGVRDDVRPLRIIHRLVLNRVVIEIPAEDRAVRAERLIETHHREVLVRRPVHDAGEFRQPGRRAACRANERAVRHGIERDVGKDRRRNGDRRDPRQDAAPRVVVEHGRHLRDPLVLAQPFVAAEEERPVLHDRPAKRSAKLVAPEIRLLVVKVVLAIELVVAEELERRAGKVIRPRLGDDVEHTSAGAAVLGAHRVGDDAELLDGFHAGHDAVGARRRVVQRVVVGGAVEREHVLARTRSRDRNLGALADVRALHARTAHDDARLQEHELRDVAAVERHRSELLLGDDVGNRAGGGFDERRGALDGNRLGHVAERQLRVDDGLLADGDGDPGADHRLETLQLHGHFVVGRLEQRHAVTAARIGDDRA